MVTDVAWVSKIFDDSIEVAIVGTGRGHSIRLDGYGGQGGRRRVLQFDGARDPLMAESFAVRLVLRETLQPLIDERFAVTLHRPKNLQPSTVESKAGRSNQLQGNITLGYFL